MKQVIIKRRFVWSLLAVFSLLVIFQTQVFAFQQTIDQDQTLKERIERNVKSAKAVFSGEVIEVFTSFRGQDTLKENVLVKMKVKESWKETLPEEIYLNTNNGSSCGYRFEKGKSYLIFADSTGFELYTDKCLLNRELDSAAEELKILGKGKTDKLICPTIRLSYQEKNLPKTTWIWSVKILNAQPNVKLTYQWEYSIGDKQSEIKSGDGTSQLTTENVDLFKGIMLWVKVGGLPLGCENGSGRGVIE